MKGTGQPWFSVCHVIAWTCFFDMFSSFSFFSLSSFVSFACCSASAFFSTTVSALTWMVVPELDIQDQGVDRAQASLSVWPCDLWNMFTCLFTCSAAASLSPHLRVVVVTGMQQHEFFFTCFESAFLALPPPPKQDGTFSSSRALGFLSAVFLSASFTFAGHLWRYFLRNMLCITRQIELDAAEISC